MGLSQAVSVNGNYISQKTSFQDVDHPYNSFVKDAVNNIFIHIEDDSGVFAFQDERLPQNILSYKIDSFIGKIDDGEKEIYTYNCNALHSAKATSEQIMLFISKDGSMDIMISDASCNQVFFNLKKISNRKQ